MSWQRVEFAIWKALRRAINTHVKDESHNGWRMERYGIATIETEMLQILLAPSPSLTCVVLLMS